MCWRSFGTTCQTNFQESDSPIRFGLSDPWKCYHKSRKVRDRIPTEATQYPGRVKTWVVPWRQPKISHSTETPSRSYFWTPLKKKLHFCAVYLCLLRTLKCWLQISSHDSHLYDSDINYWDMCFMSEVSDCSRFECVKVHNPAQEKKKILKWSISQNVGILT